MNAPAFTTEPIAVIGRGCRLPAAAGLDEFWQLILSGRCAEKAIPPDRLDRELLYHPQKGRRGSTYVDIACLIDSPNVDVPDGRLPSSLKSHPEQTYATLASVAMETVDDATLDPLDLPDDNLGVFIGHTRASGLAGDIAFANYVGQVASMLDRIPQASSQSRDKLSSVKQQLVEQVRQAYPHDCPHPLGASSSAQAISDALHGTGPYMAFNAACASSTQAIVQAVRSLQAGRVRFAIAGGASYCHSDTLVLFSHAHSLSPSGSRPWDAAADGLVVGEGSATIMLCRLSDAERMGLPVHALIAGIGISSDGKGKSLWAPRCEGQVLAIERAYRRDVQKSEVGYIEAHATSTQVGDATELQALVESYRSALPPGVRIPIGSVKANIGHTLEAAGIAGVMKVLLAMQHETIPPVKHIQQLNPKLCWDTLPFELPAQQRDWQPGDRGWTAGVNAFGIGGLNTHIVLQRPKSQRSLHASTPQVNNKAASKQAASKQAPSRSPREPIAIVGVGCILPGPEGAHGVDAFWQLMQRGDQAIVPLPESRWNSHAYPTRSAAGEFDVRSRLAGEVRNYQYDWRRHRVPPKQVAHASPLQFMILDAVDNALADAGITLDEDNRQNIGVVAGTVFGGEFANQLQLGLRLPELEQRLRRLMNAQAMPTADQDAIVAEFTTLFLDEMPALLDETGSFTSSSLASRITKSLNLMGGATAVDSGDGASGAAIMCCIDQLLAGDNEMMVCIGAQQDLGPSRFLGMTRAGVLGNPERADGSFPGEGSVVLLLERETDARRKGHPIRAIIDDIAGGYVTRSPERSTAITTSRLMQSVNIPSDAIRSVHFTSHGNRRLDAMRDRGTDWAMRPAQPDAPKPAIDASAAIGDTAGASLAVATLAAIARLNDSDTNQPTPVPMRHFAIGGGAYENNYQLLIRKG